MARSRIDCYGLPLATVQKPLTLCGAFKKDFISEYKELGAVMAAGIRASVF
jgi:hypothetical protein